MRVLLTGASGFVGRHLRQFLVDQDVEVAALAPIGRTPGEFAIESVTDVDGMRRAVGEFKPDYLFHLAGMKNAKRVAEIYEVNVLYAVSLLQATREAETTFTLVGSAAEYGGVRESDLPLTEDHPVPPATHYGIGKLAQTHAGLTAANEGRRVVVARPFNVLGPDMPDYSVVGAIIGQLLELGDEDNAATITLGDLRPTRDFIDVRDAVACLWDLAREPAAYGQVVNVCSGQETSIRALATRMIELSGRDVRLQEDITRFRSDEVLRHVGDNSKLAKLTGRCPTFDLDSTLTPILSKAQESSCGPCKP